MLSFLRRLFGKKDAPTPNIAVPVVVKATYSTPPRLTPWMRKPTPTRWTLMVAGASHHSREGQFSRRDVYKTLKPGQRLRLVREPDNPFDPNCICVYQAEGAGAAVDLGFIARGMATYLAKKMDQGAEMSAKVQRTQFDGKRGQFARLYIDVEMVTPPPPKKSPTRKRKPAAT